MILDKIADSIEKIIEPFTKRMFLISSFVVLVMSAPIFMDVLFRYFFDKAIPGVIEIEELMMVLIVFLALAYTQMEKAHITIDLFYDILPKRIQPLLDYFTSIISFVLFGVMSWQTILQVGKKWGEITFAFQLPISIFIAVAAFGVSMLTLVLFIDCIRCASGLIKDGRWIGLFLTSVCGVAVLLIPIWLKALPWSLSLPALGGIGMLFMGVMLLLRMPIGFAMALTGLIGMTTIMPKLGAGLHLAGIAPYEEAASFVIAVVPLYIFMGTLAFHTGIGKELFDTAYKWFGRMPGGLAMASVATCGGFAAVCGDSLATAITMGSVALPEMKEKNYSPRLATGCIAAGGTLGILIPPSVGFIFYAIVTEESVGKLFIAGIVPGLVLTVMFMLSIYLMAKFKPEMGPRGEAFTFTEKLISLKGTLWFFLLFILILGGILGGFFSPTEGGAVGVVGIFICGIIRKRLTWEQIKVSYKDTARITCQLLAILMGVSLLSFFMAATRLPFKLTEIVTAFGTDPYVVLAVVIILFIILGCIMNVIPMILLTMPAIFPTIMALGFDPIWFGVITVIVMEMGQITPPIGVIVFAMKGVAVDVPIVEIFKGVFPFFLVMVLLIILLTVWPEIATWLPKRFFS